MRNVGPSSCSSWFAFRRRRAPTRVSPPFVGGMRQRVVIAMAIACNPTLLIADEPTTALDVTIQAQILELLKTLQREHSLGLLLITHDLGVVRQIADRIIVMYAGTIVEEGQVDVVLGSPRHPTPQACWRRDRMAVTPSRATGSPTFRARFPPRRPPARLPFRTALRPGAAKVPH